MHIKSCFRVLGAGLADHLSDPEQRLLFEYHRDRIAAGFIQHVGLSMDQESLGGFLNGFVAVIANFVPDNSVEQDATFPVLGGIYLLAAHTAATPATAGATDGFVAQLATVVATEMHHVQPTPLACAEMLVRVAFQMTPDVAITRLSLAGFTLGVLYAAPYISRDIGGPEMLIAAASRLASGSTV